MMFVDDRLIPNPLRDIFIRLRHISTGNVESDYRVFGLKSETDFPDFSLMMMDADGWDFPVCRPEELDEDFHRVSLNDIVALNPEISDILTDFSEIIEIGLHNSNVYEDRFVRVV